MASNWNSTLLTHGWQKGVTAFYYALGMTEADFDKPQIGIGVPRNWYGNRLKLVLAHAVTNQSFTD